MNPIVAVKFDSLRALDFVNLFRLSLDLLGALLLLFGGLLLCTSTLYTPKKTVPLDPLTVLFCGATLMVLSLIPLMTFLAKYNLLRPKPKWRTVAKQTAKEFYILLGQHQPQVNPKINSTEEAKARLEVADSSPPNSLFDLGSPQPSISSSLRAHVEDVALLGRQVIVETLDTGA